MASIDEDKWVELDLCGSEESPKCSFYSSCKGEDSTCISNLAYQFARFRDRGLNPTNTGCSFKETRRNLYLHIYSVMSRRNLILRDGSFTNSVKQEGVESLVEDVSKKGESIFQNIN